MLWHGPGRHPPGSLWPGCLWLEIQGPGWGDPYLLGLHIVPAHTPERAGAKVLLDPVLRRHSLRLIWADAGFNGPEFTAWVAASRPGTALEIVPRPEGQPGFQVLPKRWIVERTFAWPIKPSTTWCSRICSEKNPKAQSATLRHDRSHLPLWALCLPIRRM